MRLIARIDGLCYVTDAQGRLYQLAADGSPGVPVPYPDLEARSLANHATWLRRVGREQCADEWQTAAEALATLTAGLAAA